MSRLRLTTNRVMATVLPAAGHSPRRGRGRRWRGMSMPELLVSLTISALVLTGAAVALVSASRAIEANDQFSRATQAGRVSLNQIMTEARRCQSGTVSDESLELTLYSGEKRTYALDADNHRLTMTLQSVVPPKTVTLARNVSDARFATDGKTISMLLVVKVGDNQISLNGSALPRRTVEYK